MLLLALLLFWTVFNYNISAFLFNWIQIAKYMKKNDMQLIKILRSSIKKNTVGIFVYILKLFDEYKVVLNVRTTENFII